MLCEQVLLSHEQRWQRSERELLDTVRAHAMRASAPIEVGFLAPIPGGCACAAGFRLAALA
jgi:hypothetical protein